MAKVGEPWTQMGQASVDQAEGESLFIHLLICPFIHLSTHPSIYHAFIYPATIHSSIHPPSVLNIPFVLTANFRAGWASKPSFPIVETAAGLGRDPPELTQQVGARTNS